jgi:ParB-like chromosome segregation protein Spo0J
VNDCLQGDQRQDAESEPKSPRFTVCRISELRPHPSYSRLNLRTPLLSNGVENHDADPVIITQHGVILDGYARFYFAQQQGQVTVPCLLYHCSDSEALGQLIQRHHRSHALNDFCRILLALELEPSLASKAHMHQHAGGKYKGSSKLTKAESIDVRYEIAKLAGVSVGNVSKVKQLIAGADPKIIEALTHGQIRIHRAWLWRGEAAESQRRLLLDHISKTGIKKKIRELMSQHERVAQTSLDAAKLASLLSNANSRLLGEIIVTCVKTSERSIHVSQGLLDQLEPRFQIAGWP